MKTLKLRPTAIGAAALLALCLGTARADVVTDWNVTALGLTQGGPPPVEIRVLALTHVAIFDAVNATTNSHQPYMTPAVVAAAGSSADAAAATAAHGVLLSLFPAQRMALDAALQVSLSKLPEGAPKNDGVAVGRQVAEQCIAMRSGDGWNAKGNYTPLAGAGKWQPTPPAMQPFGSVVWADVTPFFLKSSTELSSPGPLAIDSDQYAKEIDEVRRIGARDSKERTADQTAAAVFTLINGGQLWSAAARTAAAAKGTTMPENARIFAVANMAAMDALIAGWALKKQYNVWRPITAIRAASANPDPKWEPLIITPPHPDYVSGHSITSGAWYRSLTLLFGGDGAPFSATYAGALTRYYSGFTQAEKEIENARIWAGIHTRTADEHGTALGRRIGELAVQRAMKPMTP